MATRGSGGATPNAPDPRKVAVILGRNEPARVAMFQFLGSIGLGASEWAHAVMSTGEGSPYIGVILEALFRDAQAVVVLMTPDDVAYLHPSLTSLGDPECQAQFQARPNVLFEAGMARAVALIGRSSWSWVR